MGGGNPFLAMQHDEGCRRATDTERDASNGNREQRGHEVAEAQGGKGVPTAAVDDEVDWVNRARLQREQTSSNLIHALAGDFARKRDGAATHQILENLIRDFFFDFGHLTSSVSGV